jgi:hypothetical protein
MHLISNFGLCDPHTQGGRPVLSSVMSMPCCAYQIMQEPAFMVDWVGYFIICHFYYLVCCLCLYCYFLDMISSLPCLESFISVNLCSMRIDFGFHAGNYQWTSTLDHKETRLCLICFSGEAINSSGPSNRGSKWTFTFKFFLPWMHRYI